MLQKIRTTEKVVKMIETENTLLFETDRQETKEGIKKEVEKLFGVKVARVNVHQRKNKKLAYVKVAKGFRASDIATRLGVI